MIQEGIGCHSKISRFGCLKGPIDVKEDNYVANKLAETRIISGYTYIINDSSFIFRKLNFLSEFLPL